MHSQNKAGIQSSDDIDRTPQSTLVKKKILLVSPDSGTIATERQFHAPPLGVLRLAGYLNSKGHQTEYFDCNLYACDGSGPSLLEKFQEQEWDFIGFSVLDETLLQDIQNMYAAHKICPGALMIAGGVEAQFNYQTLLDKTPCRIVILGEGETPLLMLANGEPWENIPGIVVKNLGEALSQELFNEATQLIPWETINYEAYWSVYENIYGDQWNDEIEEQVRVEKIHSTLKLLKKYNIRPFCNFILSTPQSTLEDLEITLDNVTELLSDDFYMANIIPAIIPLKGTEFFEMYWDMRSTVVKIQGTDHLLRRDEYIHAEDPLMREFQARFIEGMDAAVRKAVEEQDIRHANQANLARMKCQYAKRLVAEIREEAASGSVRWTEGNTIEWQPYKQGDVRPYKQGLIQNSSFPYAKRAEPELSADPDQDASQPGDSTRHMLV